MTATYSRRPGVLQLAGTVQDSIVDGPGLRFVVFTQGCPLQCFGCHNEETWDPAGGRTVEVAQLVRELDSNPLTAGLTITGGEPTMQPLACAQLATAARERDLNVWVYSGFTITALLRRCRWEPDLAQLLENVNVLVAGPYVESKRSLAADFRGSSNQLLIDMPATLRTGQAVEWVLPQPKRPQTQAIVWSRHVQ